VDYYLRIKLITSSITWNKQKKEESVKGGGGSHQRGMDWSLEKEGGGGGRIYYIGHKSAVNKIERCTAGFSYPDKERQSRGLRE